jgi:hypothetical protein
MCTPLEPAQVELGVVCGSVVVGTVASNVMGPEEEYVRSGCCEERLELQGAPFHVRVAAEANGVAVRAQSSPARECHRRVVALRLHRHRAVLIQDSAHPIWMVVQPPLGLGCNDDRLLVKRL